MNTGKHHETGIVQRNIAKESDQPANTPNSQVYFVCTLPTISLDLVILRGKTHISMKNSDWWFVVIIIFGIVFLSCCFWARIYSKMHPRGNNRAALTAEPVIHHNSFGRTTTTVVGVSSSINEESNIEPESSEDQDKPPSYDELFCDVSRRI